MSAHVLEGDHRQIDLLEPLSRLGYRLRPVLALLRTNGSRSAWLSCIFALEGSTCGRLSTAVRSRDLRCSASMSVWLSTTWEAPSPVTTTWWSSTGSGEEDEGEARAIDGSYYCIASCRCCRVGSARKCSRKQPRTATGLCVRRAARETDGPPYATPDASGRLRRQTFSAG
jgi:hypothetical protein